MSDLSLIVRRTIPADVESVFRAWTLPEHIMQWWGPDNVTCNLAEIDLRVGGGYRLGNVLPDGNVLYISGKFLSIDAPHELAYTWQVDGSDEKPSRVRVRFQAQAHETEVIVIHELITTDEIKADHLKGWLGCLAGLAAHYSEASD